LKSQNRNALPPLNRRLIRIGVISVFAVISIYLNRSKKSDPVPVAGTDQSVDSQNYAQKNTKTGANEESRIRSSKEARTSSGADSSTNTHGNSQSELLSAISAHRSIKYIEINDVVVDRLLRDDLEGSRHQKWIVKLANGQTAMAVYNIDLADRVPLRVGDHIKLGGELLFNQRDGRPLLHWLHADPRGQRRAGFVEVNGKRYGTAR
jgi:Protein of unknown function (DUF3465)